MSVGISSEDALFLSSTWDTSCNMLTEIEIEKPEILFPAVGRLPFSGKKNRHSANGSKEKLLDNPVGRMYNDHTFDV